jgi:RNA-splicing ligase RtcB
MALKIGEEQAVQMPMKTVISLIVIVALGTMGYFQIVERLNIADTKIKIMEKDLEENTEFRIKWPRGEMGSLPADSEQFMMLEDLYKQTDKINKQLESMMNNRINIEFLRGQMDKVLADIEALKVNLRLVDILFILLLLLIVIYYTIKDIQ